jgi:MFS family permease
VDYAGAAALVGGLAPILLVLLVGGRDIAWTSPVTAALLLGGLALLAVFVRIERHAEEPIIPLGDLASTALGAPVIASALMNAALIATLRFTPLFTQGVLGQSATQSGGVLAPMTTAWGIASIIGGQLIARTGRTRRLAVVGLVIGTGGVWLIAGMSPDTPAIVLTRNLVVVGIGLGLALSAVVISAQNALPVERVGVAVGLTTFARAIGATLATAGLGGFLTASVGAADAQVHGSAALSVALGQTFLGAAALVALATVAAGFMRDDEKLLARVGAHQQARDRVRNRTARRLVVREARRRVHLEAVPLTFVRKAQVHPRDQQALRRRQADAALRDV